MSSDALPVPTTSASPSPSPPGLWKWIYNHNPFYVISTLLMLYAVRAAYGVMAIGEIDSWALLGVMGAYTLVLATIGVLIVRWGRVWEDARSIVLLLLLLFLAVSVSADDLFTREESTQAGRQMLAAGYLFSAFVTEAVLIGARLRLSWLYRGPLHLFLLFFYAAPYMASPEIQGWLSDELNWVVFLFPNVAAVLFLTLLPAVRRGPDLVAVNGTPWRWPLYPWTAFGMIAFAVAFRSYVFALTFCQTGKIWIELPSGSKMDRSVHAIALDTIWGPYFLVPLLLAILLLVFEASLATGNVRLTRRTLWLAPGLVLLAMIPTGGRVYSDFLHVVTERIGSPVWLTGLLVTGFYAVAWLRGVTAARFGVLAALLLFCMLTPTEMPLRLPDLTRPIAAGLATAFVAWEAWRLRSSGLGFLATLGGTFLAVSLLPESVGFSRVVIGFHMLWLAIVALGLAGRDDFAGFLRTVGAALFPMAALLALQSVRADFVPLFGRVAYLFALSALCWEIGRRFRLSSYHWAFGAIVLVGMYALFAQGYWTLVAAIGPRSATAIAWSLGTLLAGTLISTHKAGWLWWPRRSGV